MVVTKTITILEDQEKWIQDHHLNLSRFVQDGLDKLIQNGISGQPIHKEKEPT